MIITIRPQRAGSIVWRKQRLWCHWKSESSEITSVVFVMSSCVFVKDCPYPGPPSVPLWDYVTVCTPLVPPVGFTCSLLWPALIRPEWFHLLSLSCCFLLCFSSFLLVIKVFIWIPATLFLSVCALNCITVSHMITLCLSHTWLCSCLSFQNGFRQQTSLAESN